MRIKWWLLLIPSLTLGAQCDVDPSTMRVGGLLFSIHGQTGPNPTLSWTACDPNQDSYEVQVGKNPSDPNIYSQNTGTTATSFSMATGGQNLDFSQYFIRWQVRTKNSGSSTFGNWAVAYWQKGNPPVQPQDLYVKATTTTGTDPNWVTWPTVNAGAETFFVNGSTGSDATTCANAKSSGTPKLTICGVNGGVSCINSTGDTVSVANGTYTETCGISSAFPIGNRNGDRTNPITIKATNAGGVTLVQGTTVPAITFTGRSLWVVDGFVIQGGSASIAPDDTTTAWARVSSSSGIVFKNLTDSTNADTDEIYIGLDQNSDNLKLLNSTFTQRAYDFIDVASGANGEIRGNDFSNGSTVGHAAIDLHASGQASGGWNIHQNKIHDFKGTASAVATYISSAGMWFHDNQCWNVGNGNGFDGCVNVIRSSWNIIENNSFYNPGTTQTLVSIDDRAPSVVLRNNIFSGGKYAIRIDSAANKENLISTTGFVSEYNIYCGQATSIFNTASAADANQILVRENNDCQAASCSVGSCQPKFTDPNAGDLTLGAGSNAIDTGRPTTPIPTGGGPARDKGALEVGATFPYTSYIVAGTVADSTPIFSWRMVDMDNIYTHATYPGFMTDTDHETFYDIEVDTSPTFDSQAGGHPKYALSLAYTSVASPATPTYTHTPPAASALASGTYYWRVREQDDGQTLLGAWSDGRRAFIIP